MGRSCLVLFARLGGTFPEVCLDEVMKFLQELYFLRLIKTRASRYEFEFKKSSFGFHYNKLRSIKDKYDPTSLFIVHSRVGLDDWDAELVCGRRRG